VKRNRNRRTRRRVVLTVVAFAAAVWLAGLIDFVESIPRTPASQDLRATDGIVVLTGGRGRIERGIDFLNAGKAQLLLISGVDGTVAARDLPGVERIPGDRLECCVVLGRAARNTRENAVEASGWARTRNVGSLRLVTADFHMPRSLFEFRRRLPDIEILPTPVSSENVRLARWWRWPGTASLLASEYTKFLAARLRGLAADLLAMS
jgi:uncharacterized SAM-binding protein YcdF (DUF218 family)